jgi:WD40 repeat protein
MALRSSFSAKQIVPAPPRALRSRSAALVARGLLDLARDSNWLVKKVFTGHTPQLALSSTGQMCGVLPPASNDTERMGLYDIELGGPAVALSVPGETARPRSGLPTAFAWSPSASDLVAAWQGWGKRLYAFDVHRRSFVGSFGDFPHFPNDLAWSESGRYLASACGGGIDARVRLWEAAADLKSGMPFAGSPLSEAGGLRTCDEWFNSHMLDTESGDEGAFFGFGRIAFSPDESTLASVVEIAGEWADDSIALLEVPTLRRRRTILAQGHVTGLAWTFDSRSLIHCSAGQAYRIGPSSLESESLPFGAELVACHPHLPVCLCFSSWLKSSAKGRLFLADLNQLCVFDEYAAEGVVDLRWSLDGSKAYAVTADGLAYIYEPPPL